MPDPAYHGKTDIIEAGSPRPGRRTVVVLVVIVLIGLAAYLVVRQSHSPSPQDATASPGASATMSTPASALPGWPTGQAPPPTLVAVLAPTRPPLVVHPAQHQSQHLAGIPGTAQWTYTVTDIGGRWVVTARAPSGAATPDHSTAAFLVAGDLSHATPIATGLAVTPGADRQSVLVTVDEATAGNRVQRFDLTGRPGETITLPAGRTLACETTGGLVLATGDGRWELWQPGTQQVRQRFAQLFTATGAGIAYGSYDRTVTVSSYARPDPLTTDFPDGGGDVYDAVLSADGRYLAVHMTGTDQTTHLIAALDVKAGQWSRMPGTPFASPNAMALTWSQDTLVLARTTDRPAVTLWTPGTSTVYTPGI